MTMKLTADALRALQPAADEAHAKVSDFVAQISRDKPLPPARDSTPSQQVQSSPPLKPRSSPGQQENLAPVRQDKKRKELDEQDEKDRQERLEDRKKRKQDKAAMTKAPELPSFLAGKRLKKGFSSDVEEESEEEAPKKRRKTVVDMLGPMAGRHGHNVGQGRITSKPGFLNMGQASEQVKTGKKHAKPLPDLSFNELEFLNNARPRHGAEKPRQEGQQSRLFEKLQTEESQAKKQQPAASEESRALTWSASKRSPRAKEPTKDASSGTKSPTSAHSMKRRREEDHSSYYLEMPPLRASSQRGAPSQQLRRSQSAPQTRSPPRVEQEPEQPQSVQAAHNFYSESDPVVPDISPRRAMSAGTVESLRNAAQRSAREQHVFLADITAFHPWSPVDVQPPSEPYYAAGEEGFAIYEDAEWPALDIHVDEVTYQPEIAHEQPYDDAETIADDELIDTFVDEYIEPAAFRQPEQGGILPPPHWLRSPTAPRPPSPPPLLERRREQTQPEVVHDAEEMRSFWWRTRS